MHALQSHPMDTVEISTCERCGRSRKIRSVSLSIEQGDVHGLPSSLELCGECAGSLLRWLDSKRALLQSSAHSESGFRRSRRRRHWIYDAFFPRTRVGRNTQLAVFLIALVALIGWLAILLKRL